MNAIAANSTAAAGAGRRNGSGKEGRRVIRAVAATAAMAAVTGLLGATAAQAAPATGSAAAASTVCTLEVLSITSRDLQESGGDEIKLKLAETKYGPWDFNVVNWVRNASLGSPTKAFTGTIEVALREVDAVTYTTIDSFVTGCSLGVHNAVMDNSNTIYELRYEIT